jgi:two-component system, OmpR family, response regulator
MRILVVEDDAKLGPLLRRGLSDHGNAADLTPSGEDALWMAQAHAYDAIVLDLMLPGLDGFETCERLRGNGVWTPVLMLTARDAVEDRVRGLDAGADDYLAKPFAFGELLARLRALTRRVPAERPARLELGDLVVDPASHAVTRDGREVPLTAREFAVLEFLARHSGQVVSRTTLLDHVWDQNFMGSTNVVDQYVGALRRKLEQPFGRPLLHTVRGVGFRLEPTP